jgi:cell division septum initiation protein DivIVA
MELERRSIERRDFPQAKRGYEPEAVDRHMRAVADAVESLKARAERPVTAGEVAAERVQAIVSAAEASAREIEERAKAEAAEHVRGVAAAAQELSLRIGELQRQVDALVQDLEAASADVGSRLAAEPEPGPVDAQPEVIEEVVEEVAAAEAPRAPEGARLVALNMALAGTPREETARYLRENFQLDAPDTLLDEVYARAAS